jgi:hypothetical protein
MGNYTFYKPEREGPLGIPKLIKITLKRFLNKYVVSEILKLVCKMKFSVWYRIASLVSASISESHTVSFFRAEVLFNLRGSPSRTET